MFADQGDRRHINYVASRGLFARCRAPQTAASLSACALEQVAGRRPSASTSIEVLSDRRSARTLRTVRFQLRHHGVVVRGSQASVTTDAGVVTNYAGRAHVGLDHLASVSHPAPLGDQAARALATSRGFSPIGRVFDAKRGRFVVKAWSAQLAHHTVEIDEQTHAMTYRPIPADHSPQVEDRTTSFVICEGETDTCAANAPNTDEHVSQVEVIPFQSTLNVCHFRGGYFGSGPIDFRIRSHDANGNELFGVTYPCSGSANTPAYLHSVYESFTHFWLNDIRSFVSASPMAAHLGQHGLPTLSVNLKANDEACDRPACVVHPGPWGFNMDIEPSVYQGYGLRVLAHEYGHVVGHSAGVMGFNALNEHENRSGREGFADALSLAYAIFRHEQSPRPDFDELTLDVEKQIMQRLHAGLQNATLFGLQFPVPNYDGVKRTDIGRVDQSNACGTKSLYDCGAVLGRVFWYAYWNKLPAASRHLGLPSGSSIVTNLSLTQAQDNAKEALAAMLNGSTMVESQLDRFHDALVNLTPASDRPRLDELFRQLCVDEHGRTPANCEPANRYPDVPFPVASLVERSFASGQIQGFSWRSLGLSPEPQMARYLPVNNLEEFVSAAEMVPVSPASKQVVHSELGVDLVRLTLPPLSSAKFDITLPAPPNAPAPTEPVAYPLQLLTSVPDCEAPGLSLTFRDSSGIQAQVAAPHPLNVRTLCPSAQVSGLPPGLEQRGPDNHNLVAHLMPGTYEVTVNRIGSSGIVHLYGVVFRTRCPDPTDSDMNGKPDACDPDFCTMGNPDNDGVCDDVDNCRCPPGQLTTPQCLSRSYNPDQRDRDLDGLGDACDPCWASSVNVNPNDGLDDWSFASWTDTDDDGICDGYDNCAGKPNTAQLDQDGDGLGNDCDTDLDGDGLHNDFDLCPRVASLAYGQQHADADNDGYGDECDCPPGPVSPHQLDFTNCEDVRALQKFEDAQRAIAHLAEQLDKWRIPGPITNVGPTLDGCLRYPCDTSTDAGLEQAAEDFTVGIFEMSSWSKRHLAEFALNQVPDLELDEAESFAGWLIETAGTELVQP